MGLFHDTLRDARRPLSTDRGGWLRRAAALPEGDTPEETPIEPPAPPEGGLQTVFRFQKAGAAVAAADLREASHQKADGKPPTGDPWSAGTEVGTPTGSALHSVKDEQRESNLATGMTALPRESDATDARAGSAVHGRRSSWMSGPRSEVSPASTSLSEAAASPVMSSGHDVSDLSRVPGRGAPSEFISASGALPDAPATAAPAPAQALLAARQQRTRADWAELQQGRGGPVHADGLDGLDGPGATGASRSATADAAPSLGAGAQAAWDGRQTPPRPATLQALTGVPAMPGRTRPADPAPTTAAFPSAARGAPPPAPTTLHIGRIDIMVQAPPPATPAAPARSPAPATDSAYLSRHYLRRL